MQLHCEQYSDIDADVNGVLLFDRFPWQNNTCHLFHNNRQTNTNTSHFIAIHFSNLSHTLSGQSPGHYQRDRLMKIFTQKVEGKGLSNSCLKLRRKWRCECLIMNGSSREKIKVTLWVLLNGSSRAKLKVMLWVFVIELFVKGEN
jgi:hypothetical protein